MIDVGSAITSTMRLLRKERLVEGAFQGDYRLDKLNVFQKHTWSEIPNARKELKKASSG